MDVFKLQKDLIHSYSNYVQSFINIADPRINDILKSELREGLLWPDPLVQLNPSFKAGKTIDELVDEGILHKECANIFRKKKNATGGDRRITLHRHQEEAIRVAARDRNYVLTTGTGSGKSLAYIVPIVDRVLKKGRGSGVTAIVVYPMNALVNSQEEELKKFLSEGFHDSKGPVTFASYTGQENETRKNEIVAKPPDILLTNYVMLELMLTRPREEPLVAAAKGLRFLVFDELHTYRGRQGSDVSLLARRAREAFEATELRFVGTSATIAAGKSFDESRVEVARVASQIFGVAVEPEDVIGETLKRSTVERDLADPGFRAELKNRLQDHNFTPNSDYTSFIADPLSSWIESEFGVAKETGGRLVRAVPISLTGNEGAARKLAQATGVDKELCIDRIEKTLLAGMKIADPVAGSPVFAFRLHQFISRGDTVYASIEPEDRRYLTLNRLRFVPGDRGKTLLPLVFCRECGQDYYIVRSNVNKSKGKRDFIERDIGDRYGNDDSIPGFLYINKRNEWPIDEQKIAERIPEDWLEERDGALVCRRERRKNLPEKVRVAPDGSEDDSGVETRFVEAPFIFCLNCGVSYNARQRSDFSKLASLSSEGRSTATTVLGASALNLIDSTDLQISERKILSFTDNRQDASLQAGHFNDFIEVGLLRGALYKAVKEAGDAGITHESLTHAVFTALALDIAEYASDPGVQYSAKEDTEKALREVLGYRLYRDLKRGWRIASPNLEQCGLLEIAYRSLDELCRDDAVWRSRRGELASASIETREKIAKVLLDYMRRESAIKVSYLSISNQERIKQLSSQRLVEPWAIDENETFESAKILYPRSRKPLKDDPSGVFLSPRGGFGQYLARNGVFPGNRNPIKLTDREEIIRDLLECLRVAGLVEVVSQPTDRSEIPGYQIVAASLLWKAGEGNRPFHDPIRTPNPPSTGGTTNAFFVDFYKTWAIQLRRMSAREHTAQVPSENRIERENRFREGKLPILFCSPTMELGVDIAGLNVVNLRNVPPTPANYAQRSGRAGRSGNPALVYTYCTTGSPHDQYFFKRCDRMVSGAVAPPRLDLTNEDLVRSHIHAVWLAATGQDLGPSLGELLDLSDSQNPTLALKAEVKKKLAWPKARERARERARRILITFEDELKLADWYSERWLDDVLDKALLRFDEACNRWRDLYRAALKQRAVQDRVIVDASKKPAEKETAKRLRSEAESQMALLTQKSEIVQADFYSYRYFAGEGFLPGYNFPRLPLSAYIPGRRSGKGRDDYLSRPRFLAISEFGPRTFIYHEGSRYKINRVILPVGENDVLTQRAKICKKCGYLHPMTDEAGPDLCEDCSAELDFPLSGLFRLANVSAKRRDRINCDEEERVKLGFDIVTSVRFGDRDGRASRRNATVECQDEPLVELAYGPAATLWRINQGERRRKNPNQLGFVLDLERGYWAKSESESADESESVESDDPMSRRTERVVPFVEDRRNALVVSFSEEMDRDVQQTFMASIQAALKAAIQIEYQLEDSELAAEPLPSTDDRRRILIYESAEGGAGVLRRIVDECDAIGKIARRALELCHYHPDTAEDLKRSPKSREDCEAACYDCLMNYYNQTDHDKLDRTKIRDFLHKLARSSVKTAPVDSTREEHLKTLARLAGSDLERDWLQRIDQKRLLLPDKAQAYMPEFRTRPDFTYSSKQTVVYIDGPDHDHPDRIARDRNQTADLEDAGYTVVRFGYRENWDIIINKYPGIFGRPS